MSGGSYDYLCWAVDYGRGLGAHRGDLRAMIERLEQLATEGVDGAALAAHRSRVVERHLEVADKRARTLTDVWHAVEWLDSADWGKDQMREVLAAFQEGGGRGAGAAG